MAELDISWYTPEKEQSWRTIVIWTVWYLYKDQHIDQCNNIEDPEINPYIYNQPLFNKDDKLIELWKKIVFSTNCAGITGYSHAKVKIKKIEEAVGPPTYHHT